MGQIEPVGEIADPVKVGSIDLRCNPPLEIEDCELIASVPRSMCRQADDILVGDALHAPTAIAPNFHAVDCAVAHEHNLEVQRCRLVRAREHAVEWEIRHFGRSAASAHQEERGRTRTSPDPALAHQVYWHEFGQAHWRLARA